MKKLLSVFVVLGIILSMLSGCSYPLHSLDIPSTNNTEATEEALPTSTKDTTSPQEELSFTIEEAELKYTLKPEDFDAFEKALADFEISAKSLTDPEEIDRLYTELEDQYDYLDEQVCISSLLYYSDLTDKDASDRYLADTKALSETDDAYFVAMRRIYNEDSAAKDIIFEDWSETEITLLQAYTEEVMQLKQRNAEIEVAYQDLQKDPDLNTKMIPLYLELVENNNRIAQLYGYKNYYEYAYQVGYDRDYSTEQVAAMRAYVAQYLIPSMEKALTAFSESFQNMTDKEQLAMIDFEYNGFTDDDHNYLTDYLDILPRQTRNDMLSMFNGNILLRDEVESAMENAFTTNIGPDRTVCFLGPGCSNLLTVVHEVGHYYASQHTPLLDIPLDLAEIHSQGNEWLFISFLEDRMSKDLHETIVNYKMYSDLAIIIVALAVDAFEERVYTHPDPGSLTGADLDKMMEEACLEFGGISYIKGNITDIQSYWRMVVVEQPVYYVSYAVSAIPALDLYTVAQEDFDQAVESYVNLAEKLDVEQGFQENLVAAGIKNPFEEEIYQQIYQLYAQER